MNQAEYQLCQLQFAQSSNQIFLGLFGTSLSMLHKLHVRIKAESPTHSLGSNKREKEKKEIKQNDSMAHRPNCALGSHYPKGTL